MNTFASRFRSRFIGAVGAVSNRTSLECLINCKVHHKWTNEPINQHTHSAPLGLKAIAGLHNVGQSPTFLQAKFVPYSKTVLSLDYSWCLNQSDRVSVHNYILNLHRYLMCGDTYSNSALQFAGSRVFQTLLTVFWIGDGGLAQKLIDAHRKLSLLDSFATDSSLGQLTTEKAPK